MIHNAFKLHDTHGMPLGVTLVLANAKGIAVDVPAFYQDALRAGWSKKKALAIVREALGDVGQSRAYIEIVTGWLDREGWLDP